MAIKITSRTIADCRVLFLLLAFCVCCSYLVVFCGGTENVHWPPTIEEHFTFYMLLLLIRNSSKIVLQQYRHCDFIWLLFDFVLFGYSMCKTVYIIWRMECGARQCPSHVQIPGQQTHSCQGYTFIDMNCSVYRCVYVIIICFILSIVSHSLSQEYNDTSTIS